MIQTMPIPYFHHVVGVTFAKVTAASFLVSTSLNYYNHRIEHAFCKAQVFQRTEQAPLLQAPLPQVHFRDAAPAYRFIGRGGDEQGQSA